ncbi:MAG: hypothetical protein HY936_06180 [Nitrosomonadales bacterium]|nr:hypothetical protein [Nitrosomonadales bacterium]
MLILRLILVLAALLLVLGAAMYIFTRNRRYLAFAWQVLRVTVLLLSVFALLFVLERYVLTGWRILL